MEGGGEGEGRGGEGGKGGGGIEERTVFFGGGTKHGGFRRDTVSRIPLNYTAGPP